MQPQVSLFHSSGACIFCDLDHVKVARDGLKVAYNDRPLAFQRLTTIVSWSSLFRPIEQNLPQQTGRAQIWKTRAPVSSRSLALLGPRMLRDMEQFSCLGLTLLQKGQVSPMKDGVFFWPYLKSPRPKAASQAPYAAQGKPKGLSQGP